MDANFLKMDATSEGGAHLGVCDSWNLVSQYWCPPSEVGSNFLKMDATSEGGAHLGDNKKAGPPYPGSPAVFGLMIVGHRQFQGP